MTERRACMGAPTLSIKHGMTDMEECVHCGHAVAWDLVENALFGFQNCEHKEQTSDAQAASPA